MKKYLFVIIFLSFTDYLLCQNFVNIVVDHIKYEIFTLYSGDYSPMIIGPAAVIFNDEEYYSGDVIIPDSISYSFLYYNRLAEKEQIITTTVPVNAIRSLAFANCINLYSVFISKNISYIDRDIFLGCDNLSSIIIDSENIKYDSRENCNSIIDKETHTLIFGCKNSIVPSGVTAIGESAFQGCKNLASLKIPNSVNTIADYAFWGCKNIATIEIGNGITTIGRNAFASIDKLTDVIIHAENIPATDVTSFYNSYIEDNVTLHVPGISLEKYKESAPWENFMKIIPIEGTEPSFTEQCGIPTISYKDGILTFDSETEDAVFHYEIEDEDIKKGIGKEIVLSAAYQISVFASKNGYKDSEIRKATLYWVVENLQTIDLIGKELKINANAILIQNNDGVVFISGVDEGSDVLIYKMSGQLVCQRKVSGSWVGIETTLSIGDICIIKIGDKSVKYILR